MTRAPAGLAPTLALALALAPVGARAGTVTVSAADAGVRVGRPPDWRAAAPGTTIGPTELLEVPDGAKVTVRLPDGGTQVFEGPAVISGRRLVNDITPAGRAVFFNKAFQDATATLSLEAKETGSTAIAARGRELGGEQTKLGQGRRGVTFLGEEDEATRSSAADYAESYLRQADYRLAVDAAWTAIRDPDPGSLEARRGHLVMARVAALEGSHELALRDLHAACRPGAGSGEAGRHRAAALVARGQAWVALGDDNKAREDFEAALALDPDGASGAQANFFLGAIALSRQDVETARDRFGRLGRFPELQKAGAELLAAVQ